MGGHWHNVPEHLHYDQQHSQPAWSTRQRTCSAIAEYVELYRSTMAMEITRL